MPRTREKLVTIAEFNHGSDAEIAKLTLDDAGIESIVIGENAACSWYHAINNYIKLQVFDRDVKRALQLLGEKVEQEGGQ